MPAQQSVEPAIREAQHRELHAALAQHLHGVLELGDPALTVGLELPRTRMRVSRLPDEGLPVPVPGRERHETHRPVVREHALDQTAGGEGLVIGMCRHHQQSLVLVHGQLLDLRLHGR